MSKFISFGTPDSNGRIISVSISYNVSARTVTQKRYLGRKRLSSVTVKVSKADIERLMCMPANDYIGPSSVFSDNHREEY